eukprot:SAG11_NODE_5098_length_1665_cov_1.454662_2_plen_260_part_00
MGKKGLSAADAHRKAEKKKEKAKNKRDRAAKREAALQYKDPKLLYRELHTAKMQADDKNNEDSVRNAKRSRVEYLEAMIKKRRAMGAHPGAFALAFPCMCSQRSSCRLHSRCLQRTRTSRSQGHRAPRRSSGYLASPPSRVGQSRTDRGRMDSGVERQEKGLNDEEAAMAEGYYDPSWDEPHQQTDPVRTRAPKIFRLVFLVSQKLVVEWGRFGLSELLRFGLCGGRTDGFRRCPRPSHHCQAGCRRRSRRRRRRGRQY